MQGTTTAENTRYRGFTNMALLDLLDLYFLHGK